MEYASNDNWVSSNYITINDIVRPEYVMNKNRVSSNNISLENIVRPEYVINDKRVSSNDITPNENMPLIDVCSDSESIVSFYHFKLQHKEGNQTLMEYNNAISKCEQTNGHQSNQDYMVDLSLDDNILETTVTIKGNTSILKHPLLDYGIESANNLELNPSPKLMDQ